VKLRNLLSHPPFPVWLHGRDGRRHAGEPAPAGCRDQGCGSRSLIDRPSL
jgi:hypothetical protein